jgi:diaminohydroxyphosphoribosylaminopyrimidine deaminase/5-amino-6-(5-phosphoribosylamino)uracil reductase
MTPEELAVHEGFMRRALELAERGRWSTAPNPTVGAVLVKDGAVAAEGWHQVCGQAHAEVNCLRDAAEKGVDPAGCDMYVTLEPCNHFGKTPPCSHAVLKAGVKRVFIGLPDMNAKAAGGAEFLRQTGSLIKSFSGSLYRIFCRRMNTQMGRLRMGAGTADRTGLSRYQ